MDDHKNFIDPIDKSDLAALVFFMFLLKGGDRSTTFEEQLDKFPKGPVEPELRQLKEFVDRLRDPNNLPKIAQEAQRAREAIGLFVDRLMAERLWSDCRTVALEQIENIARFA